MAVRRARACWPRNRVDRSFVQGLVRQLAASVSASAEGSVRVMAEFLLDTDSVSFALRGHGNVAERIVEHRPSQLAISSITLAELKFGADTRRSRKLHRL